MDYLRNKFSEESINNKIFTQSWLITYRTHPLNKQALINYNCNLNQNLEMYKVQLLVCDNFCATIIIHFIG